MPLPPFELGMSIDVIFARRRSVSKYAAPRAPRARYARRESLSMIASISIDRQKAYFYQDSD